MKLFLRKMALVFGFLSLIIPILMLFLWHRYIDEQASLSTQNVREICEPYNFAINRKSEKLVFSWQTDGDCSGFVLLGTTYSEFSNLPYKVTSSIGDAPSTDHEISILKQDEIKYRYAIIVSEGEWYGIRDVPFVIPKE